MHKQLSLFIILVMLFNVIQAIAQSASLCRELELDLELELDSALVNFTFNQPLTSEEFRIIKNTLNQNSIFINSSKELATTRKFVQQIITERLTPDPAVFTKAVNQINHLVDRENLGFLQLKVLIQHQILMKIKPNGISADEMAARFNISQRTINGLVQREFLLANGLALNKKDLYILSPRATHIINEFIRLNDQILKPLQQRNRDLSLEGFIKLSSEFEKLSVSHQHNQYLFADFYSFLFAFVFEPLNSARKFDQVAISPDYKVAIKMFAKNGAFQKVELANAPEDERDNFYHMTDSFVINNYLPYILDFLGIENTMQDLPVSQVNQYLMHWKSNLKNKSEIANHLRKIQNTNLVFDSSMAQTQIALTGFCETIIDFINNPNQEEVTNFNKKQLLIAFQNIVTQASGNYEIDQQNLILAQNWLKQINLQQLIYPLRHDIKAVNAEIQSLLN